MYAFTASITAHSSSNARRAASITAHSSSNARRAAPATAHHVFVTRGGQVLLKMTAWQEAATEANDMPAALQFAAHAALLAAAVMRGEIVNVRQEESKLEFELREVEETARAAQEKVGNEAIFDPPPSYFLHTCLSNSHHTSLGDT